MNTEPNVTHGVQNGGNYILAPIMLHKPVSLLFSKEVINLPSVNETDQLPTGKVPL